MIVVSGDSFTSNDQEIQAYPDYNTDFQKWPDYVEGEILNIAEIGLDNVSMFQ